MRLSLLSMIVICSSIMSLSAKNVKGQELLDKKISITLKNETLFEALEKIRKQADIQLFYATNIIDPSDKVNISANKTSLREVLNDLLAPYMLNYIVSNNKIVIRKTPVAVAINVPGNAGDNLMPAMYEENRNIDVSGRVMSSTGEYLAGVTVQVKGGGAATKTDVNGFFRLSVPENSTLVFTYVGYMNEEMSISGRTNFDIVLKPTDSKMEEVVVVGYGTQKKVNLTGAVDQVTQETLKNRPVSNLSQALVGASPNLNITMLDGKPT
ncbi:MAG: carboxypeptidase-like regulatory domain-containing protein [Agriterribacter sp.]